MRTISKAAVTFAVLTALCGWASACAAEPADSLTADQVDSLHVMWSAERPGMNGPCGTGVPPPVVATFVHQDVVDLSAFTWACPLETDAALDVIALGSYGLPELVRIRAGKPHQVAYMLDGVPFTDPQVETVNLGWLPLTGVSGLSVIKGGASSLFGSGAESGAVDAVTPQARSAVPMSRILSWWGDFGTRLTCLDFRREIAGRLGFMGAYENSRSGGWIDRSSARSEKFYGRFGGTVWRSLDLDVFALKYDGGFEMPDSCGEPLWPGTGDLDESRRYLKATVEDGGSSAWSLSYYWADTSYPSLAAGDGSRRDGRFSGSQIFVNRQVADSLTMRLDAGYRQRTLMGDGLGDRSSQSLYLGGVVRLRSGGARFTSGMRFEKNSDFDVEYAGVAAAGIELRPAVSVYAKLDRSFGFPGFETLYWQGSDMGRDRRVGPEHTLGFEVGLEACRDALSTALAGYWRRSVDMTAWRREQACAPVLRFGAESEVRGLEITSGVRYPDWVETNVSLALVQVSDDSGDPFDYVPEYAVAWLIRARRPVTRHVVLGLTFAGSWIAERAGGRNFLPCSGETVCLADSRMPGYTSAVLVCSMAIDRATVFARARNLFGDRIESTWGGSVLAGRTYEFGISWEIVD